MRAEVERFFSQPLLEEQGRTDGDNG
jgi:hypothetical protein